MKGGCTRRRWRILRNEADAEDAAQEAVLKAFKHIGQFRAEARFSTWLIQIAVNEARMRRRKQQAVVMEPMVDQRDEEGHYTPRDFADWSEIPSETLERAEVRQKLAEALNSLGQKYREVFILRDMQQLSIEDTAKGAGHFGAVGENALAAGEVNAARSAGAGAGRAVGADVCRLRRGTSHGNAVCEEVWREISNYLDGEVSPEMRAAMEEHFRGCKHCTAVVDGARNVVKLYGDERMLEVPLGFSQRLQRRLEGNMPGNRRTFLGWMVAAAAGLVVAGSFEVARSSSAWQAAQRSQQAKPGSGVPPDMMVLVSSDAKIFHVAGCTFIHDKAHVRTMVAREAEREGYAPCVRCLKKYLS